MVAKVPEGPISLRNLALKEAAYGFAKIDLTLLQRFFFLSTFGDTWIVEENSVS